LVEPLFDGIGLLGPLHELFPDMSEEDWAPYRVRYPDLVAGEFWRLPVMCFLVRADGQTVLVDTGAGPKSLWNDWMPQPEVQEGLLRDLRGHGVEPEDVDVVFLTHVHVDHVGWNAYEDGSPVFTRARYILHEDALAAARRRAGRTHIDRCVLGLEHRLETVRDGDEIAAGLRVIPLPGHDDGHVGLRVGDEAVIVADAVPHPAQLDHPEWTFAYDEDSQKAIETRRLILEEFGDLEIFTSHLLVGWRR
jgi:glyoxylase-like metal-dependent hydrolase (beta-lactamase superfamily II)